jgi:hypothetical protein
MSEPRRMSRGSKLAAAAAAALAGGALWAGVSFAGGGDSRAPAAPAKAGKAGKASSFSGGTAHVRAKRAHDGRQCPFENGQADAAVL